MNNPVDSFITEMNTAVSEAKRSNAHIFEIYMNAYETSSASYLKEFEDGIDMDASSIRKMRKICGNPVVVENMETLPLSWGTLYDISTMKKGLILQLIKDDKLNSKTTKKEVAEIKIAQSAATVAPSSKDDDVARQSDNGLTLFLKSDINVSDENVIKEVHDAIHILEKYFDVDGNLLTQLGIELGESA